jgi:hypothetical protein
VAEVIGVSTAIDADRNAQSGYIAEDEQTKPEMLTQPIILHISSASRSKARSIAVMGALKLLATPTVAFVLAKLPNLPPLAAGGRAIRGDADRRESLHLRGPVSAAGEPVSGAVALGTLRAAVTLPMVVAR